VPVALLGIMQSVQDDFDSRVGEIDRYFNFVSLLDSRVPDALAVITNAGLDDDALFKTMKANCFLLLYNLMEATTKNSIQGIYDHLRQEGVVYDDCCDLVKKVAIKNIRHEKLGVDQVHAKLGVLVTHMVTETYQPKYLLSGSVDRESLVCLARSYGVSTRLASRQSDGKRLEDVKKQRNALAHGNLTFDEVGRDATWSDLIDIKGNVVHYMQSFINNVNDYLAARKYLA